MSPKEFFNMYEKALWRALAATGDGDPVLPGPAEWWKDIRDDDLDKVGFGLVTEPKRVQELLDLLSQDEPITQEVWDRVPLIQIASENLKLLPKYTY